MQIEVASIVLFFFIGISIRDRLSVAPSAVKFSLELARHRFIRVQLLLFR